MLTTVLSISQTSTLHRITIRKTLNSLVNNALYTEAHLHLPKSQVA